MKATNAKVLPILVGIACFLPVLVDLTNSPEILGLEKSADKGCLGIQAMLPLRCFRNKEASDQRYSAI